MIDCERLRDKFEFLLEAYVVAEDGDGEELYAILHRDWALFSIDLGIAQNLLVDILNGAAEAKYSPRMHEGDSAIEQWRELRVELRSRNRFFPDTAPDADQLQFLSSLLAIDKDQIHADLYRARIKKFEKDFSTKDLMAPPPDLVGNGRANPVGIPYLYVASDAATAVAEVRPSKGDIVYVATLRVPATARIVDLTDPRNTISPFDVEAEALPAVRSSMDFLCVLGEELSAPAIPHRAHLDYLASQYLCELLKKFGYDGVRYKSSVGGGMNYAFFDVTALEIKPELSKFEIVSVSVQQKLVD